MTMLTHTGGPVEPARHSSSARDAAETGATTARMATIKRFWMSVLAVLIAGGALAGIIALKAAIFLSRISH
jgi:hypothetical protein